MPEIPNVVPGEPVESDWGNDIRDRAVMKYADATERDFSQPFPEFGELAWLDDPGWLTIWTGAGWVPIYDSVASGARFVFKSGDVMSGDLTAPNLVANNRVTTDIVVGALTMDSLNSLVAVTPPNAPSWQTVAELPAFLPNSHDYICTFSGSVTLNATDLNSYCQIRMVRASDDFLLAQGAFATGQTITGVARGGVIVESTFFMGLGTAVKFQIQRAGNGNTGTVQIQSMSAKILPTWRN